MLIDVNTVKYIYKYVYKGMDKAIIDLKDSNASIK